MQPLLSIPPGHIISSPLHMVGQLEGHSVSPSHPMGPLDGQHRSGIGQPSASIPPGHINSSGPHSMGTISGQAETAAAKRVKVMKAFMVNARILLRCWCIFQESFYTWKVQVVHLFLLNFSIVIFLLNYPRSISLGKVTHLLPQNVTK